MGILSGFSVTVDPGHMGKYPLDPGAVDGSNPKEGDKLYTVEASTNLLIAKELFSRLTALGAKVVMTRTEGKHLSLAERCAIANKARSHIFISIHCNSGPARAEGVETLYHPNSSNGERLAKLVQQEIIGATKAPNRGAKKHEDLYVLNGTNMPACLVELGFISNVREEVKLNNPQYRTKIVGAIVKACIRYKKGDNV